ncbi:MAG: rRNA maturation RNase YbeY [Lachnospiraceae bacterium]|nr:rRNA maturation RNase YbeY [Lachnospiraceae bacterium]
MTYGFENEVAADFGFDSEALYKKAVDAVLNEVGCPYETQVDLLITDSDEIKKINREHRSVDAVTDVLSFPMCTFKSPADFKDIEDDPDCFNIETGELMLGDIVICAERISDQALEYGHSKRREYAFLIVHSMLHLFGYDHIDDNDRIVMEEKQRIIMDALNIPR